MTPKGSSSKRRKQAVARRIISLHHYPIRYAVLEDSSFLTWEHVADDKPMKEVYLENHLDLCRYLCRVWRPQGVEETRYYFEVRAFLTKREPPHCLTSEQCRARFPRLIRLMSSVAILSLEEAACGIRDYRSARDERFRDLSRWGGGEAVAHFGGPEATIRSALKNRHQFLRVAGRKYLSTGT